MSLITDLLPGPVEQITIQIQRALLTLVGGLPLTGANVASAATITPTGKLFHVTGTTGITAISTSGIATGTQITIIFDGVLILTNGATLKLKSTANYTTTAGTVLSFAWDGTAWQMVAETVR